jgi:hypothetical protein
MLSSDMDVIFKDLENSLPSEPSENDDKSYCMVFRYNDLSFKRRFSETDTIEVSKIIF